MRQYWVYAQSDDYTAHICHVLFGEPGECETSDYVMTFSNSNYPADMHIALAYTAANYMNEREEIPIIPVNDGLKPMFLEMGGNSNV
jgi:hypothetical protein